MPMSADSPSIHARTRARYSSLQEWINECKATVRRDLDNVILFSGEEGVGKSNIALPIMKALDESFTVDRITFSVMDFIEVSKQTPKYASILGDEFLLNKRKGMHGPTIALLDHLQRCRYLNLHMGICFPRPDLMDKQVLQERVRWNIHSPKRGIAILRKPTKRVIYTRKGVPETIFGWKELGRWKFKANSGPFWEEYLAHKHAHTFDEEKDATGEEAKSPARKNARPRCPNCDVACRAIYVKPNASKAPQKKKGWVECPSCEGLFKVS